MKPTALFWLTFGPALGAVVAALVADAFGRRDRAYSAVSAAALLTAGGLVSLVGGWDVASTELFGVFRVGAGYSLVPGVVLVLSGLALTAGVSMPFGRSGRGAALVALAALGSALAAASVDLLITLLALETVAVSAYALVAVRGTSGAREAAFKYFLQGAIASALMTLGIVALAAAASGGLRYGDAAALTQALGMNLPVLGAVLLVFAAMSFKLSAAPLHSWAPDAYQHAPAEGAAVLAGPVKLGAMGVLASYVASLVSVSGGAATIAGTLVGELMPFLAALAVISVLVGSLTALNQRSYRRMLGYAGVAQAGYGLVALASLDPSAAVLHLLMYSVASVCVFTAAGVFEVIRPEWDGTIGGLAGLGRRHPVLAAATTVALASLAGLPPFGGFWGKLRAFGAPISAAFAGVGQMWVFVALAAAGILGSVVSLAYYGAVVKELFFGESGPAASSVAGARSNATAVPPSGSLVIVGLALVLLALGTVTLITGGADPFSRLVLGG